MSKQHLLMNDTLLCQTLGAMTKDALAQMGCALLSPIFNPSRLASKCLNLFRFFEQKSFQDPITHESAFASIYPDKPFNRHLLDNVMSSLLEAVRQFIAYSQWLKQSGEMGKQLAMAKFYRETNFDHRFTQAIETIRREKSKQPASPLSTNSLFQSFLLEKEVYDFQSPRNTLKSDLNLNATFEQFVLFVLSQGLELVLLLEHQRSLTSLDARYWDSLAAALQAMSQAYSFLQNPLPELYSMAIQLVKMEASIEEFDQFLLLLDNNNASLDREVYKLLASMSRHYCTANINRGSHPFRAVLQRLHKSHLSQGILHENGQIPLSILLNMVNNALGTGEFAWAKQVLETNQHCIGGSESPEVAYQVILAQCLFKQKDFQAASSCLDAAFDEMANLESRSNFKDSSLKLMAKNLEIQLLYETDCSSSLLTDRLNAHKMFIHRNKHINSSHKTLYNNFVDLLKQLTQPATQTDAKKAKKLLGKLKQPGFLIADRRWVTEKVEALINPKT
jgi:hypothetical protein